MGFLDQSPYILMELLDGRSLRGRLRDGAMPQTQVVATGIQIASALAYAHREGVVHLDLKPSNILFAGNSETAKITDFGIAIEKDGNRDTHGALGTVMATPRYMSPEQAAGATVGGSSDLFSLGVILYEMLTGRKAFDADALPGLIDQVRHKNPAPINKLNPSVTPKLQKIVEQLMQKKAGRRFGNAGEVVLALQDEQG